MRNLSIFYININKKCMKKYVILFKMFKNIFKLTC